MTRPGYIDRRCHDPRRYVYRREGGRQGRHCVFCSRFFGRAAAVEIDTAAAAAVISRDIPHLVDMYSRPTPSQQRRDRGSRLAIQDAALAKSTYHCVSQEGRFFKLPASEAFVSFPFNSDSAAAAFDSMKSVRTNGRHLARSFSFSARSLARSAYQPSWNSTGPDGRPDGRPSHWNCLPFLPTAGVSTISE